MQDIFRIEKEKNKELLETKTLYSQLHIYGDELIKRKIDYFEASNKRRESEFNNNKIEQLIGYKNRISELLETASMYVVKAQTI